MEKIIYALWRDEAEDAAVFNGRLLGDVARALTPHVAALRINIADDAVVGGSAPRMVNIRPQMEAAIQVWVDSAHDPFRAPIDAIIADAAPRHAAWLVCESTPLPNTRFPPVAGRRTEGFSQLAFIGQPPRLTHEQFLHNWGTIQTSVAVETQDNFAYHQNLVIRPLTYGAPHLVAIVEECFPMAAFNDEAAYFDAIGNPALEEENKRRMAEACAQFMDFARIDVIQTSQFEIRSLTN